MSLSFQLTLPPCIDANEYKECFQNLWDATKDVRPWMHHVFKETRCIDFHLSKMKLNVHENSGVKICVSGVTSADEAILFSRVWLDALVDAGLWPKRDITRDDFHFIEAWVAAGFSYDAYKGICANHEKFGLPKDDLYPWNNTLAFSVEDNVAQVTPTSIGTYIKPGDLEEGDDDMYPIDAANRVLDGMRAFIRERLA